METEAGTSQAATRTGPAPAEGPRESLVGPVVALVITHGVMPLGIALVLLFRVPQFVEFFKSMDVELPSITVLVVNLARTAKVYGLFLPVGLAAFLAADAAVYCALRRLVGRAWAKLWWVLVFLAEAATLATVYLAMILPAESLMQTISE